MSVIFVILLLHLLSSKECVMETRCFGLWNWEIIPCQTAICLHLCDYCSICFNVKTVLWKNQGFFLVSELRLYHMTLRLDAMCFGNQMFSVLEFGRRNMCGCDNLFIRDSRIITSSQRSICFFLPPLKELHMCSQEVCAVPNYGSLERWWLLGILGRFLLLVVIEGSGGSQVQCTRWLSTGSRMDMTCNFFWDLGKGNQYRKKVTRFLLLLSVDGMQTFVLEEVFVRDWSSTAMLRWSCRKWCPGVISTSAVPIGWSALCHSSHIACTKPGASSSIKIGGW